MVSKASEDLPEPDRPVNTTSRSRGMSRSTFLRLCSRAPRIEITRRSAALRSEVILSNRFLSERSFIANPLVPATAEDPGNHRYPRPDAIWISARTEMSGGRTRHCYRDRHRNVVRTLGFFQGRAAAIPGILRR